MQFWPFTRWKFLSPVSYWQQDHYGLYVTAFEIVIGIAAAAVLMSRFNNYILRVGLGLAMLLYVAVPAYFILT